MRFLNDTIFRENNKRSIGTIGPRNIKSTNTDNKIASKKKKKGPGESNIHTALTFIEPKIYKYPFLAL